MATTAFALVFSLIAVQLHAAKLVSSSETREVLEMPADNRGLVIKESFDRYRTSLKDLAFSPHESMRMRWRALMELVKHGGEGESTIVEKASKAPEWFMRNASMIAAQSISEDFAQTLARRLLNDEALVVRSAAVEVLGASLSGDHRALLWKELQHERNFRKGQSLWIRPQIVRLLSKNHNDAETSKFSLLLKDQDADIKLMAKKALEDE